jgi:hypothetical protein
LGTQSETEKVARKSKTEIEKQAGGQAPAPTASSADGSESKTAGAARKPRQKKVAPKKKTAGEIKSAPRKQAPSSVEAYEPSAEEIRLRAYFIAERRLQLSLDGDSTHDWIEARRQLIEEANRTVS